MNKILNRNHMAGLTITVVGILFLIGSKNITDPELLNDPGPVILPFISGVGMILTGIIIIFQKDQKKAEEKYDFKNTIALFCVIGLYTIMLYFLGFLIATPVLLFLSNMIIGKDRKNLKGKVIFSFVVTAIIFLTFEKVLHVMLPSGVIF